MTSIYLLERLKHGLALAAGRHGWSQTKLIREAIARLVADEEHCRPRPRHGLFASGDPALAERIDEVLAGYFGCEGITW